MKERSSDEIDDWLCCLFVFFLLVLRQLVLSWDFAFRLTRSDTTQFRLSGTGHWGQAEPVMVERGEAISHVHNISLSHILIALFCFVLFCLFDNLRSCTRYYSIWLWVRIRISLASYS